MKTVLVDAVDTFVVDKKINTQMYDLLEKYPNKKIILTNANDEQMVSFGLVDLPYELYTLKHEPDKVDPKYFKLMLKHYKLSPEDVIYFEHAKDAVESANSVGITVYYYDPDKKDLELLKLFLDKNLSN